MAKSFYFPCHCHSGYWSVSPLGPSKFGIFIRSWRRIICLDEVFLLPVLVPSCFGSLFQLQPGKDTLNSTGKLCLQKPLFVGEISVQLLKNMALNVHRSVEEVSHCILAVTKEIQALSFLSASYAPLDYASLSPFTLSSTLFISFQADSWKDLSFSYGLIDWAFLTQIPLQDFAEMTSKYHHFEATCFFCPLMSFEFELQCSVLTVRQSWRFPD